MITLGLLLGAVIPLFAGVPWTRALGPARGAGGWPLAVAYGYPLGLLVIASGMRAIDLAHAPVGLATSAALPIAVGALGWWRIRGDAASLRASLTAAIATWRSLPLSQRVVFAGLVGLIALRLLSIAGELLPRPLFPWEAVSAVATKARVWYESGALVPFVSPAAWLGGAGSHTDVDPSGLAFPSLLLLWGAACMGQWHEGAVGFAWWMLAAMLTLGLYGHVRQRGGGVFLALAAAYVFIALPLVDLNAALAGAPQWITACGVGLAGCAMLQWLAGPSRAWLGHVAIGLAMAAAAQLTALPWLVLIGIAAVMRLWQRGAPKIAIGVPLLALVALLALQQMPETPGLARLRVTVAADWLEALQSLFLLDNWHLLFVFALFVAIIARRVVFTPPWLPATWLVGMGMGLMLVAGTLAMPGVWYGGLRDMSPVGLQLAPMLVMWLGMAAHSMARRAAGPAPG